ncbi:hypothetical protein R3Q06_29020 [Rhodococcus erythropolis]|uniref:hypothetical protein n=1 Tax=Rhodococcus erythropolis TaxID=1833 RepID=UPI00294A7981|nr:hypothetical protein [Rhodococcus erythropolis]MDV6277537.1 hypothetical protein [Rhodococcus erythropolis]
MDDVVVGIVGVDVSAWAIAGVSIAAVMMDSPIVVAAVVRIRCFGVVRRRCRFTETLFSVVRCASVVR